MKTIICIICMSLMLPSYAQPGEQNISSEIDSVMVFLQKAQINRSANVQVPKGKSVLTFTSLASGVEESSLQVRAEGDLTILSVSYQLNYLDESTQSEEIVQLDQRKKALMQDSVRQYSLLEVFFAEEQLLRNNQRIGGDNIGLELEKLRAIADFQRERMTEVLLRQNELKSQLQTIRDTLLRINQQLQSLQEKKERPSGEVLVTVSSEREVRGDFVLSYIVPNAGWFTQYDVRVDQINEPIQLHYKAQVYQNTGEDWEEVKLKLSSGNPSESGTQPELQPWDLGFKQYYTRNEYYFEGKFDRLPTAAARGITQVSGTIYDEESGEPLMGTAIFVRGTAIGTFTKSDGKFSLPLPPDAKALTLSYVGYATQTVPISSNPINVVMRPDDVILDEVVVTGYGQLEGRAAGVSVDRKRSQLADEEADLLQSIPLETEVQLRTTTFIFDIEEPYTIASDGKMVTVDITQYRVDAGYQYFAVPKLDQDAFLTARITNWESLNLLAGEANLFLEGTFVGNALLNPDEVEDTLFISLGRDKGIGITREKQKDFSRRQVIGGNRTEIKSYEIIVRNNKPQSVNITVEDQFPRSTNKDIEIKELNHEGAKLDDDTRKLTWELTLAPGEIRKLNFAYEVKYPKDQDVVLE